MLSRQSRSPANTASAPVAAMSVTILSEISRYLTQLPATSAPIFVKALEITAVRTPRMDQEQTIDILQFRVWESGDNRWRRRTGNDLRHRRGSWSNRLAYLFILCSRQGPPNSGQFAGRISPQVLTIGLVAVSTRGESEAGAGRDLEVAAGLRASELPRRADRRNSLAHARENLGDMTYFDQPALPV